MENPEWQSSAVNPDLFIDEYTEYEIDFYLRDILKNKNVAIVGPSSHLLGSNSGSHIDSFDIVVKVGFLEDPSLKVSSDYGSRSDIIIHSFNCFEIPVAKLNIEYLINSKFVICGMVSSDYIEEHEDFFRILRNRGCRVQNINDTFLYGFFRRVGTICNLGIIGIEVLLKYEIESLYVTGINFYNMGRYGKVYSDDYFNLVSKGMNIHSKYQNGIIEGESARSDLHQQQPQIDYFRNLVKKDSRIKLDGYLEENLFRS